MNIKNKVIILLSSAILFGHANCSEFSGSEAFQMATPYFMKRHDILYALEPIEILIPRGTFAFTNWYITSIEEYFHNVVTPILSGMITRQKVHSDREYLNFLEHTLLDRRSVLMEDGYKKAYDIAVKMKTDHAFNEVMVAESENIGSLLVLQHYHSRILSAPYDIEYAEVELADEEIADEEVAYGL